MAKSRVKKRVKRITCDCDFNNFTTTTLKFSSLSYAIIYQGIANKVHLLKLYNNLFIWNY